MSSNRGRRSGGLGPFKFGARARRGRVKVLLEQGVLLEVLGSDSWWS